MREPLSRGSDFVFILCLSFFCSAANPIGLAVAQLASPYIVTTVSRIPMMVSRENT